MHVITGSCVLLLWMCTLTLVNSKDCTREQFLNGRLFDSNFDTTNLETSYPGGTQVRVGCNVGFSGFFRLLCIEGKWQSKDKPCQPRPCGHPGEAQFGDFNLEKGDDFVFGSQVVYTCHKGYQMVSRTNFRRCMSEGWDGVVPVCEAQQCPVIHVDDNVQVIGDPEEATYGNVIQFSCKSITQIMSGSQEMYCDENGEWRGQVPKCKEITCTVPKIENGFVPGNIPEYNEHEVLHFRCDDKYQPTVDRPSKCIKQGIRADWSPTPACELIRCRLTHLEGTRYDPPSRNLFSPGDTVRVICGNKHWISNPRETSAVNTCKENGEWAFQSVCQEVVCTNQVPQHVHDWGVSWYQRRLDETVRYSCKRDYKKTDGATVATCTRGGWSPNPLCQEITCNSKYYEDADIDGEDMYIYRNEEKVKYICKAGYEGRFTLTCKERGWTGTPKCIRTPCKKLHIDDAQIINNKKEYYRLDEPVKYTCSNNPKRVFTVTCEQDGWTGIINCSACPEADVANGFVVGPYNDKFYYTCNEGFKLFTKGWWAETKCNDGVWSGFKRCIGKRKCGEIPVIANGKVTPPPPQRTDAPIVCDDGYSAQVENLTCSEGKWLSHGLSLETICTRLAATAVPCSPPRKVDNAVVDVEYQKEYLSNTTVTYLCRDKYTISEGADKIRCKEGKWEEKNIMCTASDQQ
ncbi:complement factor H-like [Cebidichthys violaceus]|uniref:complement factor H-like n=1 Tax=Cebidichthys violaceus TaxID=271503 RepID=UPI0035C9AE7C